MKIILADNAGFCFGVKRAVKMTEEELLTNKSVASLGPLIHNQQAVEYYGKKGLSIINSTNEANTNSVIIRSHGVTKDIIENLNVKVNKVIDTTCPFVKSVHNKVYDFNKNGYTIIIVGDKDHPEVIGINGWCDNNAIVLNNIDEAKEIKDLTNICVVSQTTNRVSLFNDIVEVLKSNNENLQVFNTICNATSERQNSAFELSKEVDAMIIIGGYHSSNTNKLVEISKMNCRNIYHIETKEELPLDELKKFNIIGITAGASTPDWIIEEVILTMNNEMNMEMLEAIENSFTKINRGDVITGEILFVTKDEIMVNINYKSDGIVARDEISNDSDMNPKEHYKPGDKIDVCVLRLDDGDGNVVLSAKRVKDSKNWDILEESFNNKELAEVKVIKAVKGGLSVLVNDLNGFMPASHVSVNFVSDLNQYKDKVMTAEIIDFDKEKRKIIVSRKNIEKVELNKQIEELWTNLEIGKTIKGTVQRLTNFGAFVDLGGLDGLIHISDLSWNRIKHPSEAVKVGEEVEVEVLNLDKDKNRISLGYKQTLEKPWDKFSKEVELNDTVNGTVVNLMEFGAFVRLDQGVDGLLHVSQISTKHINKPSDVLKLGDQVSVKIIGIDEENEKISLSSREDAEAEVAETKEEVQKEEENINE